MSKPICAGCCKQLDRQEIIIWGKGYELEHRCFECGHGGQTPAYDCFGNPVAILQLWGKAKEA